MTRYNKLVRDNIPEIIKKCGEKCKYHVVTENAEFLERLYDKLDEETEEFKAKPSIEELADIMEVLEAIARLKKYSIDDIKRVKKEKKAERGGFDKKIVLDSTE